MRDLISLRRVSRFGALSYFFITPRHATYPYPFPFDFYRVYKSLLQSLSPGSLVRACVSAEIFRSTVAAHFHVALRLFFIISRRASFTFDENGATMPRLSPLCWMILTTKNCSARADLHRHFFSNSVESESCARSLPLLTRRMP